MRTPPLQVGARRGQPLGMPPARFLRDYWQKRPLLIRNSFADFPPPLTPDDLAGLACEETALARIVTHDARRDRWTLRSGPFAETDFARLPASHWTLLVQDVDKWDDDVAALLTPFAFLPSWRIDDVMVSYAADGGGVGAHVDHYDVFLLQGIGQRHWSISVDPNAPSNYRDDVELKLLREFAPTHEWTLQPGDMLYLPPGVPHEGVAIGECMTFSIGMRAPSAAELMLDFAARLAQRMPEEERYADPDLSPSHSPGEIDQRALQRARRALGALAGAMDADDFADWFGCFITSWRSTQMAAPPARPVGAKSLDARLERSAFACHPWSRFAFRRAGRNAVLYAGGDAHACPAAWARALAGHERALDGARLAGLPQREAAVTVLAALINAGHLLMRRR